MSRLDYLEDTPLEQLINVVRFKKMNGIQGYLKRYRAKFEEHDGILTPKIAF